MSPQVWVITGASRGLGKEFAQVALKNGCYVAATARKPETITAALGEHENLMHVALDVTNPTQIKEAISSIVEKWGRIDVLINNAGYGIFGALEEVSDQEVRSLFDTNFFGTMNVTRAVLPIMRNQKSGRIISLGSMASFACDPGGSAYDASKFAIAAMSETLSLEMGVFGIESMVVEPGMFRTNFFDSSSIRTPANPIEAYDNTPARGALNYCLDHNYQQNGDPAKVAQVVYEIATAPEKMPLWLPIGADSVKKFEKKLTRMVESIQPYKERLTNCSIED